MPSILQPIERTLSEAMNGQEGLCVLSQVVVMRLKYGIDDYLFRRRGLRFSNDYLQWKRLQADGTYPIDPKNVPVDLMDAFLPNYDDDGWPIDGSNIDVIDISDYVTGYNADFDTNAAASASCSIQIANDDSIFSPENIVCDLSDDKIPRAFVYSGLQTPLNAITGLPVISMATKTPQDYRHKFFPNYMALDGNIEQADPTTHVPLFATNNVVKIREAYHNPDWNATLTIDPTAPSGDPSHPLIWVNRFLGFVSAASPSNSSGKPGLTVTVHDFMKFAAKGTTQRSYVPVMVTNDCNVSTPQALATQLANPDTDINTNKIFYNPTLTTRAIKDLTLGLCPINFLTVEPEILSVELGGKVALSVNQDWSPAPEAQIAIAAYQCDANGIVAGEDLHGSITVNAVPSVGLTIPFSIDLPNSSGGTIYVTVQAGDTTASIASRIAEGFTAGDINAYYNKTFSFVLSDSTLNIYPLVASNPLYTVMAWGNTHPAFFSTANIYAGDSTATPTVKKGAVVRWYDSYDPVGRPVRIDSWKNIYMCMDRFFNPNLAIGATHPFISNYGNWSFVLDAEIDIGQCLEGTVNGYDMVLFALYVEGACKVYWDGAEVGSTDATTTLADYANFLTRGAQPIPELTYQSLKTNRAIVQPADSGVISWTAQVYPADPGGVQTRFHRLKIVYQCGSHLGNRNILALRWWGRNEKMRTGLLQNASALEGTATIRVKDDNASNPTGPAKVNFRNGAADLLWFTSASSGTPLGILNDPTTGLPANIPYKDGSPHDSPSGPVVTTGYTDSVTGIKDKTSGYLSAQVHYPKVDPYYTSEGDAIFDPYDHPDAEGHGIVSNEQWVPSESTNFTMGSNGFIAGEDVGAYVIVDTDANTIDKKFWYDVPSTPGGLPAPEPGFYDYTVALHYRSPVVGEKVPQQMFRARIDLTSDDPDWGYTVLPSRGGIEFNQPNVGLGTVLADSSDGTLYTFRPTAKYVYKFQDGSLKIDDIISDVLIEDALGVDRYTTSTSDSMSTVRATEYPLYSIFRYGWWEANNNSTGFITDFGTIESTGVPAPGMLGATDLTGSRVKFFKPKVAIGQVQRVPDALLFDLSNTSTSYDGIRKLLDLIRQNFFLYATEEGLIRGRFLKQSGLPRLVPPAPGAIQTSLLDREFYSITAVGYNRTLDLPQDDTTGLLGPLVTFRETTILGEVMLDAALSSNPYPDDTAVLQASNRDYRSLNFEPIFLESSTADPNSASISPRDLTARDLIQYYKLYKREWRADPIVTTSFRWVWSSAQIPCDATGVPPGLNSTTATTGVTPYTVFWSDDPLKQADTYKIYWVIQPDKLGGWVFDVPAPPTENYDPNDLRSERIRLDDTSGTTKAVRPLVIGYDYKLDAMTSLSFPRDDFDAVTQVQVWGTRNGYSNPDLVAAAETQVIFTSTTNNTNANLPPLYAGPGVDTGTVIKQALTQTSFNAGSNTGFNIGWLRATSTSSIVNSCSTIFLVDEPHSFDPEDSNLPTRSLGSDTWPGNGWPGSWDTAATLIPNRSTLGLTSSLTMSFTDLKTKPRDTSGLLGAGGRSYAGSGWPMVETYMTARFNVPTDDLHYAAPLSNNQWSFYTTEGRALGVTQDPGGSQTADNLILDKMRGGYVQDVEFEWNDPAAELEPVDRRIQNASHPDDSSYFELFTLDFGRTIQVGEIGIAVGFAPYEINCYAPAKGKLFLGPNAKFFRWIIGTGDYIAIPPLSWIWPGVGSGDPPINVMLYDIAGFADINNGAGNNAGRTTWYTNAANTPPVWQSPNVTFWLTAEENYTRSVNGGAPQCEFSLQLELGALDDNQVNPTTGLPNNVGAIRWHTVVTEQRLITQAAFYTWGDSIFKNYPARGRYLRISARRPSPVQYMAFMTRNATLNGYLNSSPYATPVNTNLTLDPVTGLSRRGITSLTSGSYVLKVQKVVKVMALPNGSAAARNFVKISWNGNYAINENVTPKAGIANDDSVNLFSLDASSTFVDWVPGWKNGRVIEIDGVASGFLTATMQALPPTAISSGGNGASVTDDVQVSTYLTIAGDRNVGNGEYWYSGVNFLPSIGLLGGAGDTRWTPWFGALPPVYHQIEFISIQKMYVFQQSDIKINAELRTDPAPVQDNGFTDPRANEAYDPKVAALAAGKTPYKTIVMPKRSLAQRDGQGLRYLPLNHRSLWKQDPSAYTEGRAFTSAWEILQESKSPRQGAQVSVIYFPELRVFQTAMVDQGCVKGQVTKIAGNLTSGFVTPFGRTFLIERLSVNKGAGPVPQSTVTLRDYYL